VFAGNDGTLKAAFFKADGTVGSAADGSNQAIFFKPDGSISKVGTSATNSAAIAAKLIEAMASFNAAALGNTSTGIGSSVSNQSFATLIAA
jgi:hypothetical protein